MSQQVCNNHFFDKQSIMFRFNSNVIPFVLTLFLASACAGEPEIIEFSEDRTFGIRHDRTLEDYEAIATISTPEYPNFSAVVNFSYSLNGKDKEEYTATGTLISPEWILTAGHNFFDIQDQNSPAPASGIRVKTGNDPNNPKKTYRVEKVVYHPTWLAGLQDYRDANDLCLVKLSTPITDIVPVALHTSSTENLGANIWFAGFGDYSQTVGQDSDEDSKLHAMENILDRVVDGFTTVADGKQYPGGLLAFDFDHPQGKINSLGDDLVNADEALLGPGTSESTALNLEGSTVEGDSGGPLFVFFEGKWEIAGVLSGGADNPIDDFSDSSYGDISIFTRVSTAKDWIFSVIR